jgi:hypothetical protein
VADSKVAAELLGLLIQINAPQVPAGASNADSNAEDGDASELARLRQRGYERPYREK